jgi:hypothetical protein
VFDDKRNLAKWSWDNPLMIIKKSPKINLALPTL